MQLKKKTFLAAASLLALSFAYPTGGHATEPYSEGYYQYNRLHGNHPVHQRHRQHHAHDGHTHHNHAAHGHAHADHHDKYDHRHGDHYHHNHALHGHTHDTHYGEARVVYDSRTTSPRDESQWEESKWQYNSCPPAAYRRGAC